MNKQHRQTSDNFHNQSIHIHHHNHIKSTDITELIGNQQPHYSSLDNTLKAVFFYALNIGKKIFFNFLHVIIFTIICANSISAQSQMSVPAEFVMRLTPPGENNDFLRPSDISIDKQTGEVFVADPGKNRIVIFDSTSTYRFEFPGADYFSSPINVEIDNNGYIYILASTREGNQLFKFDYDGLFVKKFDLNSTDADKQMKIVSIAIENDKLYVLDGSVLRVYIFDLDGNYSHSFPIMADETEKFRNEQIISNIYVLDSKVYLVVSTLGRIMIYTTDGEQVRSIGNKGNKPGQLNFPVDLKISDNSMLMILDKHRYNVVCYSLTGKFLGEFGGKGNSPGWFYHPTILAVNKQNQAYIGQIFENKIQLCDIPEFITTQAESIQANK